MKTKTLYTVATYEGSRMVRQARKLRTFDRARRLVKRLKSMGVAAHVWPVTVDQSARGLA